MSDAMGTDVSALGIIFRLSYPSRKAVLAITPFASSVDAPLLSNLRSRSDGFSDISKANAIRQTLLVDGLMQVVRGDQVTLRQDFDRAFSVTPARFDPPRRTSCPSGSAAHSGPCPCLGASGACRRRCFSRWDCCLERPCCWPEAYTAVDFRTSTFSHSMRRVRTAWAPRLQ